MRLMLSSLMLVFCGAASAAPAPSSPPEPVVTAVMTQPLPDYPGKEALILTVEYHPAEPTRCTGMTRTALCMCSKAGS